MDISILLAVLAMVSWGVGDFFLQKGSRLLGSLETLTWIGIIGSIGLFPFAYKDFQLLLLNTDFWILILVGIVTFFVAILNFNALRAGKLSVIEVILLFELPITVFLSILFMSDSVHIGQLFLIMLLMCGVVLIAMNPRDLWNHKKHFLEKGALTAFLAAIGYGLINFLTAYGAKEVTPFLAIWIPWFVFTVMCCVVLFSRREKLASFIAGVKRHPTLIVFMGIIDTLAWLFFAYAARDASLSVTIAITESYPVISLFLGVYVNKERVSRLQYFGVVLAVVAGVTTALIYG